MVEGILTAIELQMAYAKAVEDYILHRSEMDQDERDEAEKNLVRMERELRAKGIDV